MQLEKYAHFQHFICSHSLYQNELYCLFAQMVCSLILNAILHHEWTLNYELIEYEWNKHIIFPHCLWMLNFLSFRFFMHTHFFFRSSLCWKTLGTLEIKGIWENKWTGKNWAHLFIEMKILWAFSYMEIQRISSWREDPDDNKACVWRNKLESIIEKVWNWSQYMRNL